MKRELAGLEMISDSDLLKMKPSKSIVPLHIYIQTVGSHKFLVFIYRYAHFKRQNVHFNGADKTLNDANVGNVFKIGSQWFTYNEDQWREITRDY